MNVAPAQRGAEITDERPAHGAAPARRPYAQAFESKYVYPWPAGLHSADERVDVTEVCSESGAPSEQMSGESGFERRPNARRTGGVILATYVFYGWDQSCDEP
ncbi:hypothetical protein Msil_2579 [Methylocella silvestris BL2]|uniref:Uncharacterized protein n=1 Tax=Methylocella silvestris (strain DSM 15510 / CIP 108128 / LMG 27833 / NCIMB 13906 / BL2) TaxID=395965 RepID=B8EQ12_METSB|nr:hypothetical protein Msil_2579 [Methylocella silvestris BL2]